MGVMLMKTVRPKETIAGMDPAGLVRFALSLEGPDGIIVGMDSKKVVQSNLDILRNFKPMTQEEKVKYASALTPFFNHHNLDWMNPVYRDGVS
jgi:predicted aldo/keto reductase-like oxidoreductase